MRLAFPLAALLALATAAPADEPKSDAHPRRVLFVQVSEYLYLNPLTHAAPGGPDRVRDAAERLARGLRVPTAKDNNQLFILSDTLGDDSPLPTKDALAKTLDGFCATTRTQDRVVIYFGVRAVEKDGKAFIVPIEGDPGAPETLVPVADVYAKLKELKAAQKLVIWDVCRHDPARMRVRRDLGPMTEALFKSLTAAPEGVQVLVSCSTGERSLEHAAPRGPAGLFAGSAYLDALRQAAEDEAGTKPGDAIPVDAVHRTAAKYLAALSDLAGAAQTPKLVGSAAAQPAAFDPKEAPAKRFELPAPKGAPTAEVKAILDELALPPLLQGDDRAPVVRLPFAEAVLKDYAADVSVEAILKDAEKYPLRAKTVRAFQRMRDAWPLAGQKVVTALTRPANNRAKREVTAAQEAIAVAIVRLELELEGLVALADARAKETKRWQAHYDFAVAELRLRMVLLHEYNRALGHVKTEALPDLPEGATGWRLVPLEKIEGRKDVKALYEEAAESLKSVAAAHKGTPWEVLAKRSLAALPGARWEPVLPAKPEGK